MLEKMGWKEGEGLGREGEGRLEPVRIYELLSIRTQESLATALGYGACATISRHPRRHTKSNGC